MSEQRPTSASVNGEWEAAGTANPDASRLRRDGCADILHQLSNVMTGVLLSAQVLSWKLPPYSRMKRSVHEIERNAQRGGELLRRLQDCAAGQGFAQSATFDAQGAVTAQEPERTDPPSASGPGASSSSPAPAFSASQGAELTWGCDPCTSMVFPKRDDSHEN